MGLFIGIYRTGVPRRQTILNGRARSAATESNGELTRKQNVRAWATRMAARYGRDEEFRDDRFYGHASTKKNGSPVIE